MSLRSEQRKLARDFFKRLKNNFDINLLMIKESHSNISFEYKSWHFRFDNEFFVYLTRIYAYDPEIDIHPGFFLRKKIKWFLFSQRRKKKQDELEKELEPAQIKIEETFHTDTTEIYENIQNRG